MKKHVSQLSTLGLVLVVAVACAPDAETPEAETEVRLVEGTRAEPGFPDAQLAFEAPERGAVVQDSTVVAELSLTGYELAVPTEGAEARGLALSGEGQHVHLIVDNEPYQALYDLDSGIELGELASGHHVLRAFPSRQWHESVKSTGAFAWTHFFVEDTASGSTFDPEAPLLTYSRPKGTYEGSDADSVMVDFYLANAELGPDAHSVRLTVNDTLSFSITEWSPHYVLGLPDGEHTFRLELLDADGAVAPGPFNSTERVITVSGTQGDEASN